MREMTFTDDDFEIAIYPSIIDGRRLIQIDTSEPVRILINDGKVFDGNPDDPSLGLSGSMREALNMAFYGGGDIRPTRQATLTALRDRDLIDSGTLPARLTPWGYYLMAVITGGRS